MDSSGSEEVDSTKTNAEARHDKRLENEDQKQEWQGYCDKTLSGWTTTMEDLNSISSSSIKIVPQNHNLKEDVKQSSENIQIYIYQNPVNNNVEVQIDTKKSSKNLADVGSEQLDWKKKEFEAEILGEASSTRFSPQIFYSLNDPNHKEREILVKPDNLSTHIENNGTSSSESQDIPSTCSPVSRIIKISANSNHLIDNSGVSNNENTLESKKYKPLQTQAQTEPLPSRPKTISTSNHFIATTKTNNSTNSFTTRKIDGIFERQMGNIKWEIQCLRSELQSLKEKRYQETRFSLIHSGSLIIKHGGCPVCPGKSMRFTQSGLRICLNWKIDSDPYELKLRLFNHFLKHRLCRNVGMLNTNMYWSCCGTKTLDTGCQGTSKATAKSKYCSYRNDDDTNLSNLNLTSCGNENENYFTSASSASHLKGKKTWEEPSNEIKRLRTRGYF